MNAPDRRGAFVAVACIALGALGIAGAYELSLGAIHAIQDAGLRGNAPPAVVAAGVPAPITLLCIASVASSAAGLVLAAVVLAKTLRRTARR